MRPPARDCAPATARPAAILEASGIETGHPGRPLLKDWSVSIGPGLTLVRGGDGSGKTSLLRCLAATGAKRAGSLTIDGIAFERSPRGYRDRLLLVEARNDELDDITPLAYFDTLAKRFPAFDRAALPAICQGLSLTEHLHKQFFMLSTGSRHKVGLAGALAAGASVNLLDDPFAGLDRPSIRFFSACLARALEDNAGQAWILAVYEAPAGLGPAQVIDLDPVPRAGA
jgi:ABC-type multidrug transport system ATPase subunit